MANIGLAVAVPSIASRQDRKCFEFVHHSFVFLLLAAEGFGNLLVNDSVQILHAIGQETMKLGLDALETHPLA
eukprot:3952241-Ditylum_brightwellii.AAC.1